jgi:hypothetical protein
LAIFTESANRIAGPPRKSRAFAEWRDGARALLGPPDHFRSACPTVRITGISGGRQSNRPATPGWRRWLDHSSTRTMGHFVSGCRIGEEKPSKRFWGSHARIRSLRKMQIAVNCPTIPTTEPARTSYRASPSSAVTGQSNITVIESPGKSFASDRNTNPKLFSFTDLPVPVICGWPRRLTAYRRLSAMLNQFAFLGGFTGSCRSGLTLVLSIEKSRLPLITSSSGSSNLSSSNINHGYRLRRLDSIDRHFTIGSGIKLNPNLSTEFLAGKLNSDRGMERAECARVHVIEVRSDASISEWSN